MTVNGFRIHLKQPRVLVPGRLNPEGGLDLVVEPGRRTVLMGRSGAGKTLLARLALGQLPRPPVRAEGQLILSNHGSGQQLDFGVLPLGATVPCLAELRGDLMSFVPQGGRENLVPGWTVREHFLALLPNPGKGSDENPRLALAVSGMEALGVAGSGENLDAVATELSEGMIRRILVSLALARGAEVLVIDEPTTGLDPTSREAFRSLLDENLLSSGAGLLLITHDLDLAQAMGGETLLVEEGVIVARTDDLDGGAPAFRAFIEASRLSKEAAP